MGCCGSKPHEEEPNSLKFNQVSPLIVVDKAESRRNSVVTQSVVSSAKQREKPKTKLSLDAATVELNGHSQYVDVCQWHPKKDLLLTASSDKKCFLWNCRYLIIDPKAAPVPPIEVDVPDAEIVCCATWSESGDHFAIGNDHL